MILAIIALISLTILILKFKCKHLYIDLEIITLTTNDKISGYRYVQRCSKCGKIRKYDI